MGEPADFATNWHDARVHVQKYTDAIGTGAQQCHRQSAVADLPDIDHDLGFDEHGGHRQPLL